MTYAIGIPTLNRADLLNPSLVLYSKELNCDIHVVNNGLNRIVTPPMVTVHKNNTNVGVGASWNQLCDLIFEKHSHAIILNDDIHFGLNDAGIKSLVATAPDKLIRATVDWCAFIIPKTIFQKVGRFDECFMPAYYEDKSYEYRMKLAGVQKITSPLMNPFVYRVSQTLEADPSIMEQAKGNRDLYIRMWGGEPKCEKFTKPFNQ